jgi:phage tail sheath protein FI
LILDYDVPVVVEDDGDGNLALASTQATGYPQKFGLNATGTNTVDYDNGNFTITWALSGYPALGPGGASAQTADYYTNPDTAVTGQMTGGSDGAAISSSDVVGASLAADQRGLWAFGKVDALMQLVAADFQTDTTVADSLITYAELNKDKFVILTVPPGLTPQEAVNWKKFQLQQTTSYAALYYPHIKIIDPVTEVATDVPCGGHIAGVYARTDISKNVAKAPAGTDDGKINWAVGLELDLTPTQVGTCNPEKINCLVQWPHTGRCVWGARSLDIAGGEWPYIQMRRLFMFVEKSVFNATHSHVFKNNGPALWTAIRTQISSFLLGLYQAGYFAGTSPDEAFYVICDRTNNPQNTVDQGIVFCDVGIAPSKPAEFIVFRFQQKALL